MDKIHALAKFLGCKANEIESQAYNPFEYSYQGDEYLVLTKNQAKEAHEEYISNIIDEMGIEYFTPNFQEEIINNYINSDNMEYMIEEMESGYAVDIRYEGSNAYENRLVEECAEHGLLKEKDFDADNHYIGGQDLVEMYTNFLIDKMKKEYGSYYGYYYTEVDNSRETLHNFINSGLIEFDVKAVSDACVRCDGYGNSLAPYDGVTNKYGEYYIFRQS